MTLYVNRIKYKGGSPRLASYSGVINNAIIDGYYFYDDDYSPTPPEFDYSKEYFTVTSWQDNNVVTYKQGKQYNGSAVTMYMSKDKQNWTLITNGLSVNASYTFTLNKGEKAYFKGNNNSLTGENQPTNETNIHCSKMWDASGNIFSLLWGDDFIGKTIPPGNSNTSKGAFWNFLETYFYNSSRSCLISARNLVLPSIVHYYAFYQSLFHTCTGLLYGPKEIPQETTIDGTSSLASFFEGATNVKETPVVKITNTNNNIFNNFARNLSLNRSIFLTNSGYPSVTSSIKYKLSTNTSVSGSAYRDFDTLQAQDAFLSIWAETENEYDGIVAGCSDYFIAGDSVTLTYVPVNANFNGYYDENDNLLSSSSTYTFTAQRSMKIKVKTS